MEYESDISMAIDKLKDELKGVEEYTEMIKSTTCPELKKIFMGNLATEKQHVLLLNKWINNAISKM